MLNLAKIASCVVRNHIRSKSVEALLEEKSRRWKPMSRYYEGNQLFFSMRRVDTAALIWCLPSLEEDIREIANHPDFESDYSQALFLSDNGKGVCALYALEGQWRIGIVGSNSYTPSELKRYLYPEMD